MALLNVVITYSATWQGIAVERWGYPLTLAVDSGAGLICIALLPLMAVRKGRAIASAGEAIPEAVRP